MTLTPESVESYTRGRLVDDDETERILAAELLAAQNYCGWHVTPVRVAEVFVLDGCGGRTLVLPTLKLVTVVSLSEEGVSLLDAPLNPGDDSDVVHVSRNGRIRKINGACWTRRLAGITATITHGYDEAPDFESVVLSAVERASQVPLGGVMRAVGPFQWAATSSASSVSQYTIGEQDILDRYRLNGTFA
jgi:hypothetical protein